MIDDSIEDMTQKITVIKLFPCLFTSLSSDDSNSIPGVPVSSNLAAGLRP